MFCTPSAAGQQPLMLADGDFGRSRGRRHAQFTGPSNGSREWGRGYRESALTQAPLARKRAAPASPRFTGDSGPAQRPRKELLPRPLAASVVLAPVVRSHLDIMLIAKGLPKDTFSPRVLEELGSLAETEAVDAITHFAKSKPDKVANINGFFLGIIRRTQEQSAPRPEYLWPPMTPAPGRPRSPLPLRPPASAEGFRLGGYPQDGRYLQEQGYDRGPRQGSHGYWAPDSPPRHARPSYERPRHFDPPPAYHGAARQPREAHFPPPHRGPPLDDRDFPPPRREAPGHYMDRRRPPPAYGRNPPPRGFRPRSPSPEPRFFREPPPLFRRNGPGRREPPRQLSPELERSPPRSAIPRQQLEHQPPPRPLGPPGFEVDPDHKVGPPGFQVGLRGEPQPEPDRRQSHRDAGHRRASSHARPSKDAAPNHARSGREGAEGNGSGSRHGGDRRSLSKSARRGSDSAAHDHRSGARRASEPEFAKRRSKDARATDAKAKAPKPPADANPHSSGETLSSYHAPVLDARAAAPTPPQPVYVPQAAAEAVPRRAREGQRGSAEIEGRQSSTLDSGASLCEVTAQHVKAGLHHAWEVQLIDADSYKSIAQKVEAKIIAAAIAEGVSMDASPKQVDAFFSEANKKRVQRLIQNYVLRYPRA